jgi:iron complex outermembrane receptor protein
VAYHLVPRKSVYATAARGFKAGGFNSAAPPGSDAYGEEHSWNYEAGMKSDWLGERLSVNLAVFYLDWRDLQVNVPNPLVPAQFYITNAGSATSKGAELELVTRPVAGVDVFGGIGYTNARFGSGSVSNGAKVGGNRLSNTPDYTADVGVQYARAVSSVATVFGRAEIVSYGAFQYDDANTASQSAYWLANFRGGVRGHKVFIEAWVRNAFNMVYIPIAFAYPGLAPSGFIGENGPPRTFGIRAGITF